jgi:hypothetical protein
MSGQEHTGRTVELTPTSTRSAASRSPATPVNSRNQSDTNQLASTLDAINLSENRRGSLLTENKVRVFLQECYDDYDSIGESGFEAWCQYFERYFSPEYVFVRPSGNPIGGLALAKMFSTDVRVIGCTLVSIDAITIMETGQSAVVLYTTDQVFSYKGTLNEDRAVISCIMENYGDELKIVHEQRTSGIPIPKETRWSE